MKIDRYREGEYVIFKDTKEIVKIEYIFYGTSSFQYRDERYVLKNEYFHNIKRPNLWDYIKFLINKTFLK